MPFPSHLAMSIGFFAGIIPSVIIIFMTLKDYDDYYEDKNFFFLMVVGFFGGIMTSLIYYWSIIFMAETLYLLVFLSIVFGFAVYEVLLFTIILSMKRFGGKFELTYYGVVLGGSVAGVLGMFTIYVYLHNQELTTQAILSMILMIPTLPMLYISIATLVGFGLFNDKYFKYSSLVVFIKTIFNVLLILWFIAFWYWPMEAGWEWMLIGFFFAAGMYYYVHQNILPNALPERLHGHRRRAIRKRRRK